MKKSIPPFFLNVKALLLIHLSPAPLTWFHSLRIMHLVVLILTASDLLLFLGLGWFVITEKCCVLVVSCGRIPETCLLRNCLHWCLLIRITKQQTHTVVVGIDSSYRNFEYEFDFDLTLSSSRNI